MEGEVIGEESQLTDKKRITPTKSIQETSILIDGGLAFISGSSLTNFDANFAVYSLERFQTRV